VAKSKQNHLPGFDEPANPEITQEIVKAWFRYDPETGRFAWRKLRSSRSQPIGEALGSINGNGYRLLTIDGKNYKASRLAWLYVYGQWPQNNLDHIDRDRLNDRIANLRDVSQSVNALNRALPSKLGIRGVSLNGKKYKARIVYAGRKARVLGSYSTPIYAHLIYKQIAELYYGENAFMDAMKRK